MDSAGSLYIADSFNGRIRKVSAGVISTVAGGGQSQSIHGPATGVILQSPNGVAVDSSGNLYIADSNRVLQVSHGLISTLAGGNQAGFSGDNGPASSALLNNPAAIAVDSAGDIYIADTGNNRIRLLTPRLLCQDRGQYALRSGPCVHHHH